MTPRDLADLVRAPAALSVPGDAIAGASAAGTLGAKTAGIAAASVCLYWAGMAANDWADHELDAVERPERPIPSGRVSPAAALTVASGLTAAGLVLAGLAGGRKTAVLATGLAAAIWTYDVKWKNTAAGPAGMALCRGLDVLMGASTGRVRKAVRPAAIVAAHTYAVTALSRREVHGATRTLPTATLVATALIVSAAATDSRGHSRCGDEASGRRYGSPGQGARRGGVADDAGRAGLGQGARRGGVADDAGRAGLGQGARRGGMAGGRRPGGLASWVNAALAGWYAARFGKAQRRVLMAPEARNVRAAVGAGITSLPALQGAFIAHAGRPVVGGVVAAAVPLGARLVKKVAAT
jgi:4-hydroxybenzoate polyprenyltransferase